MRERRRMPVECRLKVQFIVRGRQVHFIILNVLMSVWTRHTICKNEYKLHACHLFIKCSKIWINLFSFFFCFCAGGCPLRDSGDFGDKKESVLLKFTYIYIRSWFIDY